jgi:hypothetical protein
MDRGDVPYHFGYLLIEALSQKLDGGLSRFAQESSQSLGLGFRSQIRAQKVSLDSLFKTEQKRWAETPLFSPEQTQENSKVILAENESLIGPFSDGKKLTWIELGKEQKQYTLVAYDPATREQIQTHIDGYWLRPEAVFFESSGWWVLFNESTAMNSKLLRRTLWRLDSRGHRECKVSLENSIREIAKSGSTLAWITEDETLKMRLQTATLRDDCTFAQPPNQVAESRTFLERLSGPSFDGQQWIFSRSQGTDLSKEALVLDSVEWASTQRTLLAPRRLPQEMCGTFLKCWAATSWSKKHLGPVFIFQNAQNKFHLRWLPVRTSALRVEAVPGQNLLALRESYWEKDRITLLPINSQSGVNEEVLYSRATESKPIGSLIGAKSEFQIQKTTPWQTVIPHFWYPTFSASPEGTQFRVETFFEDITQTWKGRPTVGWNTYTQRPIANFSLSHESAKIGSASHLTTISGFYSPVRDPFSSPKLPVSVQNRYGSTLSWDYRARGHSNSFWSIGPQVTYLRGGPSRNLSPFHLVQPAVVLSFGEFPWNAPWEHVLPEDVREIGLYNNTKIGWIRGHSVRSTLSTRGPFGKAAWNVVGELGSTSEKNLPREYFEWGGLPTTSSTEMSSFLSRGFSAKMSPAKDIVRAAANLTVGLSREQSKMSWNRLRIDALDSQWIAESVSYSPVFKNQERGVGNFWRTSLGTQLIFRGSAVHWVDFDMSLGLFRGLNKDGETRASLVLSSRLGI